MIKVLSFSPDLVPLILSGEKSSTWRLWDDKDLKKDDNLEFLNKENNKKFANAIVTEVIQKKMGELNPLDKNGHEKYINDEQMYNTYSNYYKKDVNAETTVKIIRFILITD